jgi:hypothetical protein
MRLRAAPQYLETLFLGALVVLLAVSFGLLGAVVFLHGQMPAPYNDISNAVQLVASASAAGACAWTYYRREPDILLVHGAFAAGTWTLANAFWYAYSIFIGLDLIYPTVADLGFAGVFLFLIAGYEEGLGRNGLPAWVAAPIVLPPVAAGAWLVAVLGPSPATLTTLVFLALAGALVAEAVLRSAARHPVLLAATLAFALTHLLNSLRSTLPDPPWLVNATGALAALSFSLFAIAYLGYARRAAA